MIAPSLTTIREAFSQVPRTGFADVFFAAQRTARALEAGGVPDKADLIDLGISPTAFGAGR